MIKLSGLNIRTNLPPARSLSKFAEPVLTVGLAIAASATFSSCGFLPQERTELEIKQDELRSKVDNTISHIYDEYFETLKTKAFEEIDSLSHPGADEEAISNRVNDLFHYNLNRMPDNTTFSLEVLLKGLSDDLEKQALAEILQTGKETSIIYDWLQDPLTKDDPYRQAVVDLMGDFPQNEEGLPLLTLASVYSDSSQEEELHDAVSAKLQEIISSIENGTDPGSIQPLDYEALTNIQNYEPISY